MVWYNFSVDFIYFHKISKNLNWTETLCVVILIVYTLKFKILFSLSRAAFLFLLFSVHVPPSTTKSVTLDAINQIINNPFDFLSSLWFCSYPFLPKKVSFPLRVQRYWLSLACLLSSSTCRLHASLASLIVNSSCLGIVGFSLPSIAA